MNAPHSLREPGVRVRMLRVRGTVQGVGFRPFVQRTAEALGLDGWVANDEGGVLIRVSGRSDALDTFARSLKTDAPTAAMVETIEETEAPEAAAVATGFAVIDSLVEGGSIETNVPPDLALCDTCRNELFSAGNRRHRYPFINCTQCGPRYSIVEALPYDRPRTTMSTFTQCPECEREYLDSRSRRFHAQPNACPDCGPRLAFTNSSGTVLAEHEEALAKAVEALHAGRIIAVKGLGGFHLMCDAENEVAVAALRLRKHREEKPLAVMFPSLDFLQREGIVTPAAAELLLSTQAPVVLVRRGPDGRVAPSVAPGNPWLGALLPYTPLHHLLLEKFSRPLVATSANLSEEPLCTDNREARERLAGIADFFLNHDRDIARPVDDSVVRISENGDPILLRRARGHSPSSFKLPARLGEPILCVGGQMKSTIAVANSDRVVLSPHIGDLENAVTLHAFHRTLETFSALHGGKASAVAHDKHPGYSSSLSAQRSGLTCIGVQHHLAHVLSCLLENHHDAHDVLGVAWDGTGYGEDGTVWGGEFLLLEKRKATRVARLRPFRLPGGEAAVRDSRRVAFSLACETATASHIAVLARHFGFRDLETQTLQRMVQQPLNSPLCSSAGRLFDAAGALLGLGLRNTFEGQMPLAVEAAALRRKSHESTMNFPLRRAASGNLREIDWEPAFHALQDTRQEVAARAAAFHRGLAQAIVEVAKETGARTVALSGGCFQNALLHDLVRAGLESAGLRVLVHRRLSPNDGSLAAGQALGALWNLTSVSDL